VHGGFFAMLLMLFAMLLRRCTLIGDLTSVLDLITVFFWGSNVGDLGTEVPQRGSGAKTR